MRGSELLRKIGRRLNHYLLTTVGVWRERRFDRRYGIDSGGIAPHPEDVAEHPAREDATRYQVTPPRRFRALMRALPIDRGRHTFVDLGCGKGRTLLLAEELGFRRVIGIEFSEELARVAERNAQARGAGVEVVHGDAGTYEWPAEPTVVYLFNPFVGAVMERTVRRLEESLAAQPRELWIVYLNPVAAGPLEASPRFKQTGRLPDELLRPGPEHGVRRRLRHERGGDMEAVVYEALAL